MKGNCSDPDSPPPGTCIALLLVEHCLGQHNRKATAGAQGQMMLCDYTAQSSLRWEADLTHHRIGPSKEACYQG